MNEEDATDGGEAETSNVAQESGGSTTNSGGQSEPTEETGEESDPTESDEEPDAEIVEWISETDPKDVAREFETLTAERDSLEEEVEALEERVQRVQADFQNYKKRTERRREEQQARATQDLVERLLPVRDNLSRALDQDQDSDIRDGVEATLSAFDDILQSEGVEVIQPSPGDSVDPTRHEVVHREDEAGEVVASVYRRGYEMEDHVLRPAQVTVGEAGATTEEDTGTDDASSEPATDE